jgi:hypothetical protein
MTATPITFPAEPGYTYKVLPENGLLSQYGAAASAVPVAGQSGKFTVTVDPDVSQVWYVFRGTTQPAGWHLWIEKIDFTQNTVSVYPVTASSGPRVQETTLELFVGESVPVSLNLTDADGNAISLAGRTLQVVLEGRRRADRQVIPNSSISRTGSTIGFTVGSPTTSVEGPGSWAVRDTTSGEVLAAGVLQVKYAPRQDT